jgi:hypothetical protein
VNARTWRPLGTAAWRAGVRAAVDEIMTALADHTPALPDDVDDLEQALLFSGRAGIAVGHACYAEAAQDDRHAGLAVTRFDEAGALLGRCDIAPSLLSGYAGIAWLGDLLATLHDGEDPSADLDDALLADLAEEDPDRDFDLVWGAAGCGMYALARGTRPVARAVATAVVDFLARTAHERPGGGVAWYRPARLLHESRARRYPDGVYDVGVAHGTPGVLAFLARAFDAGIERERIRPLLARGAAWILGQAGAAPGPFTFPSMIGPTGDAFRSRFGWCYGDLSVAGALHATARALGDDGLAARAIEVALASTEVSLDTPTVFEPGLCHGAAGIGHLFHRFYQETSDARFAIAAQAWLDRCLAMRRPDLAFAGFAAAPAPGTLPAELGLLEGITGVALALLAAVDEREPRWDELLAARP